MATTVAYFGGSFNPPNVAHTLVALYVLETAPVDELWFVPTREGEFEIACAELCGFGHYQMRAFLRVVSEGEFDRFLAEKQR